MLTGVNGTTITYDEIGNPSSNGAYHRYTWQNGRQLAQIFDTSHVYTYSYTYNADGIRTSKTVNGQKHTYTLNGSQIVSEEWTSGSTTHTLVYLYDESGSPIGLQYRPSSMVKEIFYTYFFEKNLQGDITAIFKENGVKIGTYCYDAWGNVKTTVSSGITALEKNIVQSYNPFRYRGYYYDTESGLYYLQSRYYNPQWGRFLNADGYISTGTGPLGYNMYAYCNNNPVIYVDPCGKCIHNGVAQGMGLDCPDCRAGITGRDEPVYNNSFDDPSVDKYNIATFIATNASGMAIKGVERFVGNSIRNATRPANIGAGQFAKNQVDDLADMAFKSKAMRGALDGLWIVMDVTIGVDQNIRNNASIDKIIFDVAVDISITGGSMVISSWACTAIGTMICPGVGTAVGFIIGFGIACISDIIIYNNGMTGRDTIKSLYK